MGLSGHVAGVKTVRRLRRQTGLDVVFAVRRGHVPYSMTVRDGDGHRHVFYEPATRAVWDDPDPQCRQSCEWLRTTEAAAWLSRVVLLHEQRRSI